MQTGRKYVHRSPGTDLPLEFKVKILTPAGPYDTGLNCWIICNDVLGRLLSIRIISGFLDSNKGAAMTHPEPTPPLSGGNHLLDDDDVILLTDEILPETEDDDIIELIDIADFSEIQQDMASPGPVSDNADDKAVFFDLGDVLEETDLKTEQLPDFSETEAESLNLDFDRIPDPFRPEPKISDEDLVPLEVLHGNDAEDIVALSVDRDSDTDIVALSDKKDSDAVNDLFLSQGDFPSALENEIVESLSLHMEPVQTGALSGSDGVRVPDAEYQMDDLQQLIHEVVHDSQVPRQDLPGIHSESEKPPEKDASAYQDMVASQPGDQIDAAVERVIHNLFAERIEKILNEVVTAMVTKEMEKFKKGFLNYLTSDQSAENIKS